MISNDTLLLLGLTVVVFVLYSHVANNIEKYASSGSLISRAIILSLGLAFGVLGALLFLGNVADPGRAFGIGFVFGPLCAIAACIYVITALFFPIDQVRGLMRYSFRHKLTDKLEL